MTHIEYVRQRQGSRDRVLDLADALCDEGLPRIEVAKVLEGAAQQLRHEDHEALLEAERRAGVFRGWPHPDAPPPIEDKAIPAALRRTNGVE